MVFEKNVASLCMSLLIKDVLSRCVNSKDISQAKHILKYIFPMQFGLHNVFTHITDRRETTHAFRDYTDREAEITMATKYRDEKVFKRLGVKVLPLISKMQKLHQKCSYSALIHHYCSPGQGGNVHVELRTTFDEEKKRSKELTQRDISTISTRTSETDIELTSKDVDIIRHHTPHNQVLHDSKID